MSGLLVNNYSQRNPPTLGEAFTGLLGNWGDNIESGLLTSFPFLAENDPYKIGQSLLREGTGLGTIAGVNAKTLNPKTLQLAEQMRDSGASRDAIWKATGEQFGQPSYFDPIDNSFRWEIDDSLTKYTPERLFDGSIRGTKYKKGWVDYALSTSDAKGSNITEAYPQMQEVEWVDYPFSGNNQIGAYRSGSEYFDTPPSITLWDAGLLGNKRSTALHEINHAIQDVEGFARGGSTRQFKSSIKNPAWENNPDAKRVDELLGRPEYEAELTASNLKFERDYEPRLAAIDRQLSEGKLPRTEYGGAADRVFEDFDKWKAANLKTLAEVDTLRDGLGYRMLNPREQYMRLLGEVDSRAVQKRMDYSLQDRINNPFWKDYDVPENEISRNYRDPKNRGLLGDTAPKDFNIDNYPRKKLSQMSDSEVETEITDKISRLSEKTVAKIGRGGKKDRRVFLASLRRHEGAKRAIWEQQEKKREIASLPKTPEQLKQHEYNRNYGKYEKLAKENGFTDVDFSFGKLPDGTPYQSTYFTNPNTGRSIRVSDHEPVNYRSQGNSFFAHPGAYESLEASDAAFNQLVTKEARGLL